MEEIVRIDCPTLKALCFLFIASSQAVDPLPPSRRGNVTEFPEEDPLRSPLRADLRVVKGVISIGWGGLP
jgi:hypothetical protein